MKLRKNIAFVLVLITAFLVLFAQKSYDFSIDLEDTTSLECVDTSPDDLDNDLDCSVQLFAEGAATFVPKQEAIMAFYMVQRSFRWIDFDLTVPPPENRFSL